MLELGGSDYFIVLADADLDAAATIGVKARFQNTGQSCIAAKRFIIEDSVYERYVELFVQKTRELKVGDPMQRDTQVGPLARADLRDALAEQVRETVAAGAKLLLGGKPVDGSGAFYEPTVVGDVTPSMRMATEETFGPAAAMMRARDAAHAVELANASRYGLGGNLWTRDLTRAERTGGATAVGELLHQRDDRVRSAPAVRRCEEERDRARAVAVRDSRVRQRADRLDRPGHRRGGRRAPGGVTPGSSRRRRQGGTTARQ